MDCLIVVFVVDSTDKERIDECRQTLGIRAFGTIVCADLSLDCRDCGWIRYYRRFLFLANRKEFLF